MIYRFGDYELDTQLFELRCGGLPLPLEPKVFDLLAHLIRYRDRVVTKPELLTLLWPQPVRERCRAELLRHGGAQSRR